MRFILCIALFTFVFLIGCSKFESSDAGSGSTSLDSSQDSIDVEYQALAWESVTHPERKNWSVNLMEIVGERFDSLDKARDVDQFCTKYHSLSRDQKINVWAQIFAVTTYYECSWNPKSYSVDVGTADDPETWSVGLLQLSVVDQKNYKFSFGYSFLDLQDPIKNLHLGVAIMEKQIQRRGVILIPKGSPGLYWAVLHPGGKHDKSLAIKKKVQALSFCQ